MKQWISLLLTVLLLCTPAAALAQPSEEELSIGAPAAILIERETGTVLYEKNADERLSPASVTKIMTLLLIFEQLDSGRLSTDTVVTASANACAMGGSQIWLKEGEQMTVDEMIKCIAVSSANDCAVAMGEHICGSEAAFTKRMNERAQALGMENTHFLNSTGLTDDPAHYTTARDIAVMSRALLAYPRIRDYTTIWMDTVRDGRFGLANTNKLIHGYPGATGLKTGYTKQAMHCVSASAERDGVEYIAVVMHCETSDSRNKDAETLLDYAFSSFRLCSLNDGVLLPDVHVELGRAENVRAEYTGDSVAVIPKGGEPEYKLELRRSVPAPVSKGDRLGTLTVSADGRTVAEVPVCAAEDVPRLGFFGFFARLAAGMFAI